MKDSRAIAQALIVVARVACDHQEAWARVRSDDRALGRALLAASGNTSWPRSRRAVA